MLLVANATDRRLLTLKTLPKNKQRHCLMTTSATTTPITASAAASDLKYLSTLIEESPDSTVNKITSKLSMTTLEEIKVIKEMYSSKIMEVMEPTKQQLFQYGLNMGIPFIG